MEDWFLKNLGDAMLAHESLCRLEDKLASVEARVSSLRDYAVFMRHESEGNLHCELKIYFSPASASTARALFAEPCERPSPVGLSMLAGSEDSWSALFPD